MAKTITILQTAFLNQLGSYVIKGHIGISCTEGDMSDIVPYIMSILGGE